MSTAIRATSTGDVDLVELDAFADALRPDVEVEVSRRQVIFKSMGPPSWVSLLADADWWLKVGAASVALFVAELVKEAAKETWRNRAKVIAATATVGGQLRRVGQAIAALRKRLPAETAIGVGLRLRDDYFAAKLSLESADENLLIAQLAMFVHHVPALRELIARERLNEGRAATGLFLALSDDGSLLVAWQDAEDHGPKEVRLPL